MTIRKVFKAHLPSVNYFFSNGRQGAFLLGRFETDISSQIQELENEVKLGHPHIYVDPAESEIDSEAPTPLELIRQEAYAQAKADLLAAGSMSDKVSTSDSGSFALSAANTATIAEAAASSDTASASMSTTAAPAAISGASLMALSALTKSAK